MSIKPSPRASTFQKGIARLVAQKTAGSTALTEVAHQSPTRLLPLRSSLVNQAGAALCAVGGYGGGMVQGDSNKISVDVKPNARLGVISQGANRVYKSSDEDIPSTHTEMNALVRKNGFLVMAPDPCALFSECRYKQDIRIDLEDETSSLVWIDWFSAGRLSQGERWKFHDFTSSTNLYRHSTSDYPIIRDGLRMDSRSSLYYQWYETNAICSVFLAGPEGAEVAKNLASWSSQVTSRYISLEEKERGFELNPYGLSTNSKLLVGVSKIEDDMHMARIAASSNEDIYRVLYSSLLPLSEKFGVPFYHGRISSSVNLHNVINSSEAPAPRPTLPPVSPSPKLRDEGLSSTSWPAFMLADSSLPTGSFAYSSGLEVAYQMGFIKGPKDVEDFVLAATQSTVQQQLGFIYQSHGLAKLSDDEFLCKYHELEQTLNSYLRTNSLTCEASVDNGLGLLRVAIAWSKNSENTNATRKLKILRDSLCQNQGHLAPIWGIVTELMGITSPEEAGRLWGYTLARDMVSAAVRLNAIGPLASLSILEKAQETVYYCVDKEDASIKEVGSCAPVLDTIIPCHDLLGVRLFRT